MDLLRNEKKMRCLWMPEGAWDERIIHLEGGKRRLKGEMSRKESKTKDNWRGYMSTEEYKVLKICP